MQGPNRASNAPAGRDFVPQKPRHVQVRRRGACGTCVLVVLAALCFLVYGALPPLIREGIKKRVSVTGPDAFAFNSFANASEEVNLYENYYLFHVENPWEVEHKGANPKVRQRGPYNFLLKKYKPLDNISWTTDGRVRYMSQTEYIFQPQNSVGGFYDEPFTTYRFGLFGIFKKVGTSNSNASKLERDLIVNPCINSSPSGVPYNAFVNITPHEMLLGHTDPLMECLYNRTFKFINSWVAALNQPANQSSSTALSSIYSGGLVSDTIPAADRPPANRENYYATYLGMKSLDWWSSKEANMINGSDGSAFPPGKPAIGDLDQIFVDTFYRSTFLRGVKNTELNGVDLIQYDLDEITLQTPDVFPLNKGFNIKQKGLQPSPQKIEKPIFFTKPYYIDTDMTKGNLRAEFQGPELEESKRDPHRYDTHLEFEPHTGQLFRIHKRIMINLYMDSASLKDSYPVTTNWPNDTYTPSLWLDEYYEVPESKTNEVKMRVIIPLKFAAACIYLGFFFLAAAVFLYIFSRRRAKLHEMTLLLVSAEEDDRTRNTVQAPNGSTGIVNEENERTRLVSTKQSAPVPHVEQSNPNRV